MPLLATAVQFQESDMRIALDRRGGAYLASSGGMVFRLNGTVLEHVAGEPGS